MQLIKKYNYAELKRKEGDGRLYLTPDGEALPSVTTILSKTKDKTFLKDWIAKKGEQELIKQMEGFRLKNKHDCLVPFSGGRDSSYSLHFIKKEIGMNPIAFSYDWGMITDLGRRNQSIMCAELGVEHILVSADIRKKRNNKGFLCV